MKLIVSKVKTDNGPAASHLHYAVKGSDLGVDAGIFSASNKGGELFQRVAPFKRTKFACDIALGKDLFDKMETPQGDAFQDGGIHNPGTGWLPGEPLEIEIYPVTAI